MPLTPQELGRLEKALAHTARMLQTAKEEPDKAAHGEYAGQIAVYRDQWSQASPDEREAVIAHRGEQKGAAADYLTAAVAALES
jgi:hypothetical protein